MSGYLFQGTRLRENLPAGDSGVFTVLRPASFEPQREADFRWVTLPEGDYLYGNSKYGMPFTVVRNQVTGESFLIHFGLSGSYVFQFYNNRILGSDSASLYFRVGLDGPGPFRFCRQVRQRPRLPFTWGTYSMTLTAGYKPYTNICEVQFFPRCPIRSSPPSKSTPGALLARTFQKKP